MSSNGFPKRLILLASAQSYRSDAFEAAARRLGLELVMGADIPLPLLARAHAELPLDYRDIQKSMQAILKYASKHPVGAVLGLDDSGTVIASYAGAALDLPHNAPQAAEAARDKFVMRRRFAEHGVPSPHFELHHFHEDLAELAARVRYPCVLKPTMLAGSRGVMRADNPAEFIARVKRLHSILVQERCNEFLVEDYIPGIEVAVEGLLDNGRLLVLALFDKPDPLEGPFFEETIYVTPSRLPEETQRAIARAAEQAAHALGLQHGPVHAELRVNDEGAWLVELAARSIGGLCSQALKFHTDISLEELVLRQAFGMDLAGARRVEQAEGVMMIPIPEAGLLKDIEGISEAEEVPHITGIEITAAINYPVVPLPEGKSYLGFIFASGPAPEVVEQALRHAHQKLHFEISPEIHLTPAV